MDKLVVIAQFFGIMGAIFMMLSNWQKNKKRMLLILTIDSMLYFTQYILLKAYTGAFINIVSFVRVVIAEKQENMKEIYKKLTLFFVMALYIISGIVTCKSIIDVLPIIGALIYTICLWQNDIQKIRVASCIMFFLCAIYNVMVKAYVGAFFEIFY